LRKFNFSFIDKEKGKLRLSLFCFLSAVILSACTSKPEAGVISEVEKPTFIPDSLRYNTEIWDKEKIRSEMKNGDIVLKRGDGSISRIVVSVLAEEQPLSHCAIVIKKEGAEFLLHSLSSTVSDLDGVQSIPLDSFIRDTRPFSFHLLRHKDSAIAERASDIALYYLEQKIPFDLDYVLTDDTAAFYCTEFVYKTYLEASGKEIFQLSQVQMGEILGFNAILEDDDFELLNRRAAEVTTE
jgi:hypothetical protein